MESAGPSRQFVILGRSSTGNGSAASLGPRKELLRNLFGVNTSPERAGEEVLYGPGIRIELTPGQDPVTQMLLTITEEEIGWLVTMRLAKKFQWKIVDMATGRELQP